MRGGLAWWERPRPRTDRGQRRRLVSLNRRTTQLAGRRPVRADAAGKASTVLTKRGVLRRAGTQALETGTPHLRISFLQRTSLPGDARRQDLPRGSQVRPGSRNVVAVSFDRGTAPPRSETAKQRPEAAKRQLNCAPRLFFRQRGEFGNDPSAGSPTETLLRLLLPLNDQV